MRFGFIMVVSLALVGGDAFGGSLAHPDWRPDGKALIAEGSCDGDGDLVLVDLETGALTTLWDGGAIESYPRWFADGRRVVFHRMATDRSRARLFIADVVDGAGLRNVRRITDGPFDIEPAPSPDGTVIAFTRPGGEGLDVALLKIANPGEVKVLATPEQENLPSWHPAGSALLYHRASDAAAAQIVLRDLQSGEVSVLTSGDGPNITGHLEAAGGRLVFASERDGDREIYLRHIETGEEERLTTRAGRDGYPRFSPDGIRIAFHRRRADGSTSIVVMTVATGAEREYSCPEIKARSRRPTG